MMRPPAQAPTLLPTPDLRRACCRFPRWWTGGCGEASTATRRFAVGWLRGLAPGASGARGRCTGQAAAPAAPDLDRAARPARDHHRAARSSRGAASASGRLGCRAEGCKDRGIARTCATAAASPHRSGCGHRTRTDLGGAGRSVAVGASPAGCRGGTTSRRAQRRWLAVARHAGAATRLLVCGGAVGIGLRVDVVPDRRPPALQRRGVDHEPVAHVAVHDAVVGLVDPIGRDRLDLRADPVVAAEVEHLLGLAHAADA